jgi:hypothetical protein
MHPIKSRADRWPLALTMAALAACADEPSGPKKSPTPKPHASSAVTIIMVTNKSGGMDVGSLRWAASSGLGATIQFDPSLAGDSIVLESTMVVNSNKIIEGPADKGITIKAPYYIGRVIYVPNGASLRVRNATITGGSSDRGSAILSEATAGPLTLEHTTVRGSVGSGAAIDAVDVTLINSTVSGNTGSTGSAWMPAGIVYSHHLDLSNSTVALNGPGPGIGWYGPYWSPGSATVRNSIIASNGSPLRNCSDSVNVFLTGVNISNDSSCGTSASMIVGSPQLYSLANNGGPTMTHSLAYDSPAINAGVYCESSVDQRYVPHDAKCDIGAFEFTDFTKVTITVNANANVDPATGVALVTGTVQCTRGDVLQLGVQLNQTQKTGKTSTVVRGSGVASVNCWTSTQPWSLTATPWSGTFQSGTAAATAFTSDPPVWVTPASVDESVKLFRAR